MRLILLSLAVLLAASCSQDSSPIAEEQQRVIERGGQLRLKLIQHDRGTQMQMYRALSAADKSAIWKAKLSQLDQTGFSAEQKQFIKEIVAFASDVSNFETKNVDNSTKSKEQNRRLNEFSLKASQLFTEKYKAISFGALENINEEKIFINNINSQKPGLGRLENCTCAWGLLCPTNQQGDGGCGNGNNCRSTSSGCGWFWGEQCTGTCIPVAV